MSDIICEPKITFIIPTIGRSTLSKALQSLIAMNNPNWRAIVMFDGIEPTISSSDFRISIKKMEKKGKLNYAGEVRNKAIKETQTEWVGFLDDDDALEPTYVDLLHDHIEKINPEIVIFRMKNSLTNIVLPPLDAKDFELNFVGISFCLKRKLVIEEGFFFEPSRIEDYNLLNRLRRCDKKIFKC